MIPETTLDPNLEQAVPYFAVSSMVRSLPFYVSGLGFEVKHRWDEGGKLRWCWLARGGAALMLQEFAKEGPDAFVATSKVGVGVRITFVCRDALALFREIAGRGLSPSRPFVGNGMWVTALQDPDGYRLEFESPTDTPEDTRYQEA